MSMATEAPNVGTCCEVEDVDEGASQPVTAPPGASRSRQSAPRRTDALDDLPTASGGGWVVGLSGSDDLDHCRPVVQREGHHHSSASS
jgi:hypothetical protein